MDSSQASTLRDSVVAAQQALEKAQVNYRSAFAIMADTGVNDDGMFVLRREGRAYDHAVRQYTHAMAAWQAFVGQHFRSGPLNPDAKRPITCLTRPNSAITT